MSSSKFFLIVSLLFTFPVLVGFAQKKVKKSAVVRQDAVSDTTQQPPKNLYFKNLNKIMYYHDAVKLHAIKRHERNREWATLFPLLREYVYNFGIQNFYKDTYLIWRLAKLCELLGDMDEAKMLYRLVLKHHREDIDIRKIELSYDSAITNDKDYFVPIEYYYEMVEYRKAIDTLRPPRGVLLNMGDVINTRFEDYGPAMGIERNVLLFTSKRNTINNGVSVIENEDLFVSRNYDGYWDKAVPLEGINSKFNEGSACITKDGKTLYFSRCESPECIGNCDLFVSELQPDNTWGNIRNLGINVNSIAWDSQPTLSHSEDTLFFSSDRIGGFGLGDIYFTYKDQNGEWMPAQNVGPIINTRNNEVSPFYHPMYKILYFSSNGHTLNFGDFDIYKSYWIDNYWDEPRNIGPLVNGPGFEYYFTIDSESTKLFYARSDNKAKPNLDLFSFPLPMEAQPTATTKLKGSLKDSITGQPFQGVVSVVDLDHGIEIAPKYMRPDGSFEFDLIDRNNYLLIITGDDFFRIEQIFFLNGNTTIDKETAAVSSKIEFESIEFEEGKSDILPEMYEDLNKVVNFFIDNHDFKLKIAGHTDSAGNPDFNLLLSQKRADAIEGYIVLMGVEEERIESVGYGSTKPIVEEKTEHDRKLNRRVEFEIIRPSQ